MPDTAQVARGERLKEARLQAAVRAKRTLSQAAMAELVSEVLGRSLSQAQWSNYELGLNDPPYDVVIAAGRLSGLSPSYIAFEAKHTVNIDEDSLIDIPPDAVERAKKQAEVTRSARAAKKGGKQRPA